MTVRGEIMAAYAIFIVAAIVFALFVDVRGWARVCRTVPDADRAGYQAAMQLYGQANGAITAGDYSTANNRLDQAISRLGKSYETILLTDDTAIMLLAGQSKASQDDFKLGARMKQSAIHTRFSMFRRKAEVSARCHVVLGWIGLG